ncbi:MAG: helix-turn-helix domain-containing protein, partial [Solirubrobacteraceae bacterium]
MPDRRDAPSARPLGRPRGSTRERILDVALELFAQHGYENTSLRDIAERLGVTKAALYYHFERKEDILFELHMRVHGLAREALEELQSIDGIQARADAWPRVANLFIDQLIANRDLVAMQLRSHDAMADLEDDERHHTENQAIIQPLQELLSSPEIALQQRVRIACSIGAVLGVLSAADFAFSDAEPDELAAMLRGAVDELTGPR